MPYESLVPENANVRNVFNRLAEKHEHAITHFSNLAFIKPEIRINMELGEEFQEAAADFTIASLQFAANIPEFSKLAKAALDAIEQGLVVIKADTVGYKSLRGSVMDSEYLGELMSSIRMPDEPHVGYYSKMEGKTPEFCLLVLPPGYFINTNLDKLALMVYFASFARDFSEGRIFKEHNNGGIVRYEDGTPIIDSKKITSRAERYRTEFVRKLLKEDPRLPISPNLRRTVFGDDPGLAGRRNPLNN